MQALAAQAMTHLWSDEPVPMRAESCWGIKKYKEMEDHNSLGTGPLDKQYQQYERLKNHQQSVMKLRSRRKVGKMARDLRAMVGDNSRFPSETGGSGLAETVAQETPLDVPIDLFTESTESSMVME